MSSSGWWGWLYQLMVSWGFFQKNATVVLLGLDNAGKSTLLHKLKTGSVRIHPPTQRETVEEMVVGNVKMKAIDLGGHEAVRHLWDDYLERDDISAIVFVVDSADSERMEEAREELETLLATPSLSNSPILVLGNKQDKKKALGKERLEEELGVGGGKAYTEGVGEMSLEVFEVCLIRENDGLEAAFNWLCDQL